MKNFYLIMICCIFMTIPEHCLAQIYDIVHHRYVLERNLTVMIPPIICVEVGKPHYFTGDTTLTANFLYHSLSGWHPSNYIDAIRALETEIVTLSSDTTTINFAFGFNFVDIDSLVDSDSILTVQYQIIDVDSQTCISLALETQIYNPMYLRDSLSGQYYVSYLIEGNRTHTFASYPGQRVITAIRINWPAIRDSIEFGFGLVEVLFMSAYYQYTNFVTNSLPYSIQNTITNISKDITLPTSIEVYQNYPNPFNESTNIEFFLNKPLKVAIDIYDILGRKLFTLTKDQFGAGLHKIQLNTGNLSSGIYFFSFQAGYFNDIKKFVIIK